MVRVGKIMLPYAGTIRIRFKGCISASYFHRSAPS